MYFYSHQNRQVSHTSLRQCYDILLIFFDIFLIFTYVLSFLGARLGIHGTHFTYNGHRVFLAGINKAWEHYAYDFGNGQYNGVKARYEHVFQQLQAAGANSIREISP